MSAAIADQAGGLAALGSAYFQRRYAILFYSLLITIAAAPLFVSIGFGTDLIELFLAVNLLAAVIPFGSRSGRRLLFGILITAFVSRLATGWLNLYGFMLK
jgi:hypothetical protein